LQLVPERVQLLDMTHAVLADVATLIREQGHTVDVVAATDLPEALLDRQLLRQVVLNLVSNAIKYTTAGGRIVIEIGQDGRDLCWSIRDNGIGIPKASQQKLFEKFYRAGNALTIDTEGTGLGLYLVRLIVERFGGRIVCESEEGRGTLFRFTLPLEPGDPT
jgi:signal transduction histidine kinase